MKTCILILSLFSSSCSIYNQMMETNSSKTATSFDEFTHRKKIMLTEAQKEKFAGYIVNTRDWQQLYFMDVHTLAKGDVYNRYVIYSFPHNRNLDTHEGVYFISHDDSELIRFIIEEYLVKYPSNEEAWNLIEFYMLYQSKKLPYFSLIFDILEENDLLTHSRAAIMLKYKAEMDQLAKREKGYVNINMFNEIKTRIIEAGVKHTLSESWDDSYFKYLTLKQKDELALLIIHSQDWNKINIYNCGNVSEKLIRPVIDRKAPQYSELFNLKKNYTSQGWLIQFIIREWLRKHPCDQAAWDFIELFMPIDEGETPYFTLIRHSLEECNLLNTPRGLKMSQYDFSEISSKNPDIKDRSELYNDMKYDDRGKNK